MKLDFFTHLPDCPALFKRESAVGRLASLAENPLLVPVYPPSEGGAWCARVTTSFRPRNSLSCAPTMAFNASYRI